MQPNTVHIPITSPGQLLSTYRSIAKLTRDELAQKAHIAPQTIYNIETNRNEPSVRTWAVLVDLLDIPRQDAIAIWT